MTTDNDKAPEWMTDEWLRTMARTPGDNQPLARDNLRLRAESATLTAELAKLREHADHDAGEILRLGGELADIKACDGPIAQAEAYGESMRHENDGLRAEIAAAQMILPMSTGTLADSARTLRTERENARAERNKAEAERDAARAERDALHKSYVAAVDERDAALACKGCGGTVSHHLAPDQGGCPGRFVIDGVPMVPVAHVEAARAEVERLNIEIGRHPATRAWVTSGIRAIEEATSRADAAIRDRNEFAASELERFCKDTLPPTGPLCGATTLDHAIRIRAAELRKAAGSVPAGERIRPFSEWSEFDGEALWFHLPVVESAFYVGRPDDSGWPYDGDPDGPDDSDQIGWVPVPRLASDGSELLRKAAPSTEGQPSILPLVRADGRTLRVGAIAGGAHPNDRRDGFPAELRLELGDVSRRHSCRYVRQAEGVSEGVSEGGKAAGAAAPAEPNLLDKLHAAYRAHDEAVARLQSRRATPAADARQPDDAAKLAEVEKREADGIKLFDDLLATERAKVATMSIELDGMRNRIAAFEKAKAELLDRIGFASTWINWASADLRRATEAAAERAGGAS